MAHVTLDGSGNITGMYARPQPNVPDYVQIADDDPRIASWLAQPAVPSAVSSMQAKVALLNARLLDAVQSWVNTQDAATQLVWNSATEFKRDSQLVGKAAAALSLSSTQIDQLFIAASAVNP